MKTWQLVSLISWSPVLVQLKQITHRLNVLCAHQVEPVGNAIDEAKKYSYQFNVKIIGLPEKSSDETAPETSSFCVKLFQEMGAEVSIFDIDTVHPVSTRNESEGPKPVVSKFLRRLAKGKVMEVRQRASQINPTVIDLSDIERGDVRIFDHLRGHAPGNSRWECAARFFKSWPDFRPKNAIFHTRFQTRTLKSMPIFKPGL